MDEQYEFELVIAPGIGEPNDRLSTATPVIIPGGGNGTVTFTGRTIGDGVYAGLDVDLYRLELPRAGLISARVLAQQLPTPSSLDGVLRLFDAAGQELISNDQFFGNDPYIDFFVPSAGVYYVGVSGFGNASYLPLVAGSGQSQSTGNYDLRVDVALVSDSQASFEQAYSAPGITIPDTSVLIDTIVINDSRQVRDVNVTLDIFHTFMSDLQVDLISPQGVTVRLFSGIGGSGDDMTAAVFDDQATRSITTATAADAPFTGSWRPVGSLADFNDQSAAGLWQLVVRDTKGNDVGSLLGWKLDLVLENDIFGPFELNDTLTTARQVDPALGVVNLTAFIGDGGFGRKDVDLYQFQAAAGSTLSVRATSAGVADLAIRLFDASGNELLVSNPAGERDAAIESFVFVDGGTYYVGISDGVLATAPTAYDPSQVGSGGEGQTVGQYGLEIQLANGVSDPGVALAGQRLEVGVSPSGAWGLDGLGIMFDGVEFLPGIADGQVAFFGVGSSNGGFVNDGQGSSQDVPFNVTSQSTPTVNRVSVRGVSGGLLVDRTISYGLGDGFIAVDVTLTNTTDRRISSVLWAEGLNPDPDMGSIGSAFTANDVVDGQPMAVATSAGGLSIALAADPTDARAQAFFASIGGDVRNPQSVLDRMLPDPNGASADLTMALAYDLGNIDPGQRATMRYFVFLSDQGQEGIAGPNGLQATASASRADMQRLDRGLLTYDPANPADDSEGLADLAYRLYYPEGYANDRASTFVPLTNFTNQGRPRGGDRAVRGSQRADPRPGDLRRDRGGQHAQPRRVDHHHARAIRPGQRHERVQPADGHGRRRVQGHALRPGDPFVGSRHGDDEPLRLRRVHGRGLHRAGQRGLELRQRVHRPGQQRLCDLPEHQRPGDQGQHVPVPPGRAGRPAGGDRLHPGRLPPRRVEPQRRAEQRDCWPAASSRAPTAWCFWPPSRSWRPRAASTTPADPRPSASPPWAPPAVRCPRARSG
ncbi:MAG: hypothetical protein KatS3mg103_0964 [Phycisphaerales bacterium]|nr:MAG: hypothetical protein KatS3mg103_0964 [Phycisphaerales bacterium]